MMDSATYVTQNWNRGANEIASPQQEAQVNVVAVKLLSSVVHAEVNRNRGCEFHSFHEAYLPPDTGDQ
jgi:hypothetical protein